MPITSDQTTVTIIHPDNKNTSVKILLHGATILSWKVNGEEKIFLSENAKLDGSKPVRGGVPLVFPRFGPSKGDHPATDKLPQHGFARQTAWEFLGQTDETSAQFALSPDQLSPEFRSQWEYDFTLLYTVRLSGPEQLEFLLEVENPGKESFDFNVLFHTYFRVPDITKTSVTGLQNLVFYNKVKDSDEKSNDEPITIGAEVDRVYKGSKDTADILNDGRPYITVKSSPSLTDTVMWNPWSNGTEKLADFTPKSGYKNMLCIENGNVAQFTKLEPGNKWIGSVSVSAH